MAKVPNQKSPYGQNVFLSSSSFTIIFTKQQHFTLSTAAAHHFFTTSKSYEVARIGH